MKYIIPTIYITLCYSLINWIVATFIVIATLCIFVWIINRVTKDFE